ncbi:MAG TPA: hypothetical protein VMT75_06435 [Candidatus Saccharimonadales bacterium]|nr:hypothetical protein [Candidatus Saccharimonadales bacterium]
MRSSLLIAVVAILSVALAQGQSKKKGEIPKVLLTSRYVYVEAVDGDVLNPHIQTENRKAIVNVQDALQNWKRYVITAKRREAEIVFVVCKGSQASVKAGGGAQGGTTERIGANASVDAQLGVLDDRLEVYVLNPDESLMGPIWRHTLKDGLDLPEMPLFTQFKNAVDMAAKQAASAKAGNP